MTDLSGIGICSVSDVVCWNFYFPTMPVAWESPVLFPALVTVTYAGLEQLFGMYQAKAGVNSWWKILGFEVDFHLFSSNFHQPPTLWCLTEDRCSLQIYPSSL